MSEKKGWWVSDELEADSSEKTANTDDEDHRADYTWVHPDTQAQDDREIQRYIASRKTPAGDSDSDSLGGFWVLGDLFFGPGRSIDEPLLEFVIRRFIWVCVMIYVGIRLIPVLYSGV